MTRELAFLVGALLGPWITPHDPVAIDLSRPFAKPIWLDLVKGAGNLGKDNLYRDVFSRVIVGSSTSLIVALSAVLIGILSSVSLGLIADIKEVWLTILSCALQIRRRQYCF